MRKERLYGVVLLVLLGCCALIVRDVSKKAAEQGYAKELFNLAQCYHKGGGVPKNLEKAASLYKESAELGYAKAQFNLALCYANGEGVP